MKDWICSAPSPPSSTAAKLQANELYSRSAMLKAVAKHLMELKADFYAISAQTGATRGDSWVDIEGGIGTAFTYASLGGRELPDDVLWPEDELIPLTKQAVLPHATC
jgi:oxepin-CoA hydrolase/3-oxo-5,6-dehydrosuberyl-CoA semialdehyde dehydrogenase